jgi:alpha-D-ribose 1-methylphosphonate 5-triphosphate synthase subunit PhnG
MTLASKFKVLATPSGLINGVFKKPGEHMRETRGPGTREFTRALALMPDEVVRELLEDSADLDFEIVREPATGLIMQSVTDCFQADFHLGEILVTTAEVMRGTSRGWGMVMGDNPDRAILAACLDLLFSSEEEMAMAGAIADKLRVWITKAEQAVAEEARLYGTTRVHFESMAER